MFGRRVAEPRLTDYCGDLPYVYSGRLLEPRPWPAAVAMLRDRLREETQAGFNHMLANFYRGGSDGMGYHADDEPELGLDPVVATVSLGQARRFLLKARGSGAVRELELGHGSLLVMGGALQHEHKHAIPKTKRALGPRLSLTFRRIVTGQ